MVFIYLVNPTRDIDQDFHSLEAILVNPIQKLMMKEEKKCLEVQERARIREGKRAFTASLN